MADSLHPSRIIFCRRRESDIYRFDVVITCSHYSTMRSNLVTVKLTKNHLRSFCIYDAIASIFFLNEFCIRSSVLYICKYILQYTFLYYELIKGKNIMIVCSRSIFNKQDHLSTHYLSHNVLLETSSEPWY